MAANGHSGFIDMLKGHDDRTCTALAMYGMLKLGHTQSANVNNEPLLFRGECKGTIVEKPRGHTTFGWDAIFQCDGGKKTFAEMETDEKNRVSHRADAMRKLSQFIEGLMDQQKSGSDGK